MVSELQPHTSPRQSEPNAPHNGETAPLLDTTSPNYTESEAAETTVRDRPLELFSVRLFRVVLFAFLAAVLVGIAALVVDIFVAIGVTSPAGSGFESLLIAILSAVSLTVTLLFYRVPSDSDRVIGYITAFFLVVDLAVLFFVPELKRRVGSTGLIVYGLSLIAFTLGAFADSLVEWRQRGLRMRLNGGDEAAAATGARHTISEWLGLFIANLFRLVILVAVFLISLNLVIAAIDSGLEPLGDRISVNKVFKTSSDIQVHVACTPAGVKGPVVLVEAGEGSAEQFSKWILEADKISTVCYWDRPGYGFSDNAPSPLAIGKTVDLLQLALKKEVKNFNNQSVVLVSHGIGGLYSRVLASRLGEQVQGLMLVDSLHEELFYQRYGFFSGIWSFLKGIVSPLGVRNLESVLSGYGSAERIYGRFESSQGREIKAVLQQQMSANRQSRRDIGEANLAFDRTTPLLVVSASKTTADHDWSTYQRLLLKLSDNAMAWKILEGPHEIWKNKKSAYDLTKLLTSFVEYSRSESLLVQNRGRVEAQGS